MGCKVLGMTATPWRLEEDLGFDRFFGALVVGPSASDLVKDGWLSPIHIIETDLLRGGSYHEKSFEVGPNGDFTERSITSVENYYADFQMAINRDQTHPVSYTHLTLPTICSV